MDFNKFTIKAQEAVQAAHNMAVELDHQAVECGHILKGIMATDENVLPFIFKKLSVNEEHLKQALDKIVEGYPVVKGGEKYISRTANESLVKAQAAARELKDEYITLEHLFMWIFRSNDAVGRMLKDAGISEKELKSAILELRKGEPVKSQRAEETYNAL